ncbi:MAG: hypothetical protein V3W41_12260 [Planctomycetota bacterium]
MNEPARRGKDEIIIARSYTIEGARETVAILIKHGITATCYEPRYANQIFLTGESFETPLHCVMVPATQQEEARKFLHGHDGLNVVVMGE